MFNATFEHQNVPRATDQQLLLRHRQGPSDELSHQLREPLRTTLLEAVRELHRRVINTDKPLFDLASAQDHVREQSLMKKMNEIDLPLVFDGARPAGPDCSVMPGGCPQVSNGETPHEVSDRISRWAKMGKGVTDEYHISRFGEVTGPSGEAVHATNGNTRMQTLFNDAGIPAGNEGIIQKLREVLTRLRDHEAAAPSAPPAAGSILLSGSLQAPKTKETSTFVNYHLEQEAAQQAKAKANSLTKRAAAEKEDVKALKLQMDQKAAQAEAHAKAAGVWDEKAKAEMALQATATSTQAVQGHVRTQSLISAQSLDQMPTLLNDSPWMINCQKLCESAIAQSTKQYTADACGQVCTKIEKKTIGHKMPSEVQMLKEVDETFQAPTTGSGLPDLFHGLSLPQVSSSSSTTPQGKGLATDTWLRAHGLEVVGGVVFFVILVFIAYGTGTGLFGPKKDAKATEGAGPEPRRRSSNHASPRSNRPSISGALSPIDEYLQKPSSLPRSSQ
jgi:hypothetical protein